MSSLPVAVLRSAVAMCVIAAALGGCGHDQVRRLPERGAEIKTAPGTPKTAHRSAGEQAAVVAVRQIGVPYLYGGSTTRGFDCSGLVQYAWSKAGARIPRTTAEQWRQLAPVRGGDLRVGDLLFFRIDGRISHVGLYLGDQRFVHAPSSGREVSVADLGTEFYRRAFAGSARP